MRIGTKIAVAAAFIFGTTLAAADDFGYENVKTGKLSGKLIVQWLEPDLFLFIPDKNDPFTYTRYNNTRIAPGRMQTDGGSIPRGMWILRNYSPWGFAPAFIVHDWLFEMKHCKYPGHEKLTLQESGLVMAEIMKTMIASGKVEAGAMTVNSMYVAVTSPFAKTHWDSGACSPAPQPGMFAPKPIQEFTLSF